MKWFQGTFTQRYNARHKLWGHLFQGRYKAKVVDDKDASYFRKVSEYIHLNPAAAGIVAPGKLSAYSWSSYPDYLKPRSKRPAWLVVDAVLSATGMPGDSLTSRRGYEAYMNLRHREVSEKRLAKDEQAAWNRMERGWIHGNTEFRDRMRGFLENTGKARLKSLVDAEQKRDLSEAAAKAALERCLKHFRLKREDLEGRSKSDPLKMLLAGFIRYHYPVKAAWVSEQLCMGHFTTVSKAMRFYDEARGKWKKEKQYILKFIG